MIRSILFFFLIYQISFAQQPASIQLTEKDGLPDIEFYNIIEDSKQFIWLAADNGLYRYNGKKYTHFTHKSQKGNAVFGTFEDSRGRVWCNNISGQFFYVENDKMHLFIDLSKELNGQLPEFIVTDAKLLVFPLGNIISVDLMHKKISYQLEKSINVGTVFQSKNGFINVQGNQILKRDKKFRILDSITLDIFGNYDENAGLSRRVSIIENRDVLLCYYLQFQKNKFFSINFSTRDFQIVDIPKALLSRTISHVFFNNDELWFSTDSGLYICNYKEGKLKLKNQFFTKEYITKVIKDSNCNYWITTKGNGIFLFPNINVLQYDFKTSYNSISQIEKINDSILLFGTNKGHFGKLDIINNKSKIIDSSSAYRISKILYNIDSNKAIVSKEDKTFQYYVSGGKIDGVNFLLNGAKDLSMAKDNYILSTYRSVEIMNTSLESIRVLLNKRSYTNHYSEKNQDYYVAFVHGFFHFDSGFNSIEIKDKSDSIFVKSITQTQDGKIWVATFKSGIYCIKNNDIVDHITEEDGLLSDKVIEIKSDDNTLWIASESGVQLYKPIENKFKNLTKQDGIPSYRITDIEVINDQVFFANNDGLFSVNKTSAFKTNALSKIYITDVSINFKEYNIQSNYDLEYGQNSLKIGFNVNGFQSFENTTYNYRLLGEDEEWQTTESSVNSINYNGLRSGRYTFEVKPVTNKTTIERIYFNIAKPFWRTWWFYLSIAFILAVLIYIFFKRQINKLKKKQDVLLQREMMNKQLVFSQLENLRSQMNPHFIFNALNSIQEYIILNEKELASNFLIKFSRLIRIYLEHSRENEVFLSEEIKALKIYLELEKNRFEDVLNYSITVSKYLNTSKVKIPSLFIQPYVENALKHGLLHKKSNRILDIKFYMNVSKTKLCCTIEDNGIGVDASKKLNEQRQSLHRSFATSANEKRVKLININRTDKISVVTKSSSDNDDSGTKVTITIPLN